MLASGLPPAHGDRHVLDSRFLLLGLGLLIALGSAPAQQPNSAEASLAINGLDFGVGAIRTSVSPCTGLDLRVSSGANANQGVVLVIGRLAPGAASLGNGGTLDLDPFDPSFLILADGLTGTLGLSPVFNAVAITDGGGQLNLPFMLSDGSLSGPPVAWQALVGDPGVATGARFTAATEVTTITAATGATNLTPPADGALTRILPGNLRFTFFGDTTDRVHVAENGLLGFDDPQGAPGSGLALLEAMTQPYGAFTAPATILATRLGTNGIPAVPTIGLFEDLDLAGGGAITERILPDAVVYTWCSVTVLTPNGARSGLSITLHADSSPTPGRIELQILEGSRTTAGNGRVLGISPGGDGTTSRSTSLANFDFSARARRFTSPIANTGSPSDAPGAAVLESFDFLWGLDALNPNLDVIGDTIVFDPSPGTPQLYTVRLRNEVAPSLTGVSPNGGPIAGGQTVTLKGTGFRDDGSITARIGGQPITGLTFVDSETMTGITPAALTTGTVNVDLTFGSRSRTLALPQAWTYTNGPVLTRLALTDEELVTYRFDAGLFGQIALHGNVYTEVHVAANGLLIFDAQAPSGSLFVSDPASWDALPGSVVAPLWNDLCGEPVSCGLGLPGTVDVFEATDSLTITWQNWAQWPNRNQGIGFSVVMRKDTSLPGGPFTEISFDYAASTTPDPTFSQVGQTSGILVGLRAPFAAPTTSAPDLIGLAGPALGMPGAIQTGPAAANLVHWMPSGLYAGGIAPSNGALAWPFGSVSAPGPQGNFGIRFLATDAAATQWTITLF